MFVYVLDVFAQPLVAHLSPCFSKEDVGGCRHCPGKVILIRLKIPLLIAEGLD